MEYTKFDAPRILNAPPVWKFSHLKNAVTLASASKPRECMTGVRLAIGRMRSEASRMSSKVTSELMTSGPVSIAGMFVHQVQQRLIGLKTAQVFKEAFDRQMNEIPDMVRRVGRKQDVFHLIERMCRREWFHREHIQRGAANFPGLERLYQRRVVDHGSAAHIDQHARGLHRGDLRATDHAARLIGQGRSQQYVI